MPAGLLTHYLERTRLSICSPYLSGRVLDIGCGYASYIRRLQPDPDLYIGIEKDQGIYRWLRGNYPEYCFVHCDVEQDGIPDLSPINCIASLAVLEHVHDPGRFLSEIHRVLPAGKRFIFTTPTPAGGRLHAAGSRIGLFSSEARADHRGFYSRMDLMGLLAEQGFNPEVYRHFLAGLNQLFVCQRI